MQKSATERPAGLNSIHIEVAKNVCNIRCNFCYIDFRPQTARYDYSGLEKVLEYCRKYPVPYVTIQGGEITAIPQGYTFCSELSKLGCSMNVMTNGVKINEKWIEIFSTSCHRVNISINTPSPQTYEAICGADWHAVYANIEKVNALRKTAPRKCDLSISMVVCKQTYSEIVDFYRLSERLGVDYIVLFPDISSPQSVDMKDPANLESGRRSYEQLRELMHQSPSIHPENRVALNILRDFVDYQDAPIQETEPCERTAVTIPVEAVEAFAPEPVAKPDLPAPVPKVYCLMPSQMVYINHNLDVFTCCGTTGIRYGNLKDENLENIIQNPKRTQLQAKIATYDYSSCSKYCTLMPR